MKVLDFRKEGFKEFLNENFQHLIQSNQKILILGIADGGIPIAEMVYHFFQNQTLNQVSLEFIKAQRPSTKQKKGNLKRQNFLRFAFSILPKFLLNYLRIIEHKKLSKRNQSDLEREIILNSEIDFSSFDLILVVDDAVDSGASMKAVFDDLSAKINGSKIKTLSVVVTQKNPIFEPDYFMFCDVLIRFPWSLDGKK